MFLGGTKFLVNSWTHFFSSGFKRPARIRPSKFFAISWLCSPHITLTMCLIQEKVRRLIVEGEKAQKPISFQCLESLTEMKERLILVGPMHTRLSAQNWEESVEG
ncbi:PKS-NRPS hybrid synthetase [Trifolium repens]|nr:PKS-NRPS hybrid synthetase [Trifolium repens]